ncbi:MAG: hypothetical protein ACOCUN_01755 [Jiangellaceae bacterium]
MKLLADLPAVDEEEPPHRPVQAILGGAAILVIMLGVGLALLLSGGDGVEPAGGGQAPAALGAEDPDQPSIDLASWTAEASAACEAVAAQHPAVTEPDEAPVGELDAGVRALTSAVREIPLPTAENPRAAALQVVARGDEAEQALDGIVGQQREELSSIDLNNAMGSTQAFVTALVEVGADCDILR